MKKKRVGTDFKERRLRNLRIFCGVMLPVSLYISFCLGGLYNMEVSLETVKRQILWCLMHPLRCYSEQTWSILFVGGIIWLVASVSAYTKLNNNLMHGREYGDAKWENVKAFNAKYAAEGVKDSIHPANKVLSENVRFRYDSDTLRNNNIFVVGGSGAGKTSFFLTPNLLSCHDCNIFTDPKGGLVEELGGWLSEQPNTNLYVLNMCEMEKSMKFNPFPYLRKKSDVTKLVTNLIQNTNNANIKNNSQDPFWERAEKMFLESLFLYVWLECPCTLYDEDGNETRLERNWKSILYLIDQAQFGTGDEAPKLDAIMENLRKKQSTHPSSKAYFKYRGGPDETVRSVIMTVNARMQPFDNEELLDVFSADEIPLNEFGVGHNGDGKTKSNLFIVIPDDDDTYNFVPGMIYTLLFQELYRQARFFGGKLPMDVGFFMDEFANTKMPNNFDKILATCRSRGVYCVPILQSLAQLKTLFAEGAWEGVIGNCDTFLYLGGNEASTFEYVSKLLGKWTIDKKTNGESKGSNGSSSENYDVLGRELMLEYEVRLLPDDECILFVRGENPVRDKKWFPWEHEEYKEARKSGAFNPDSQRNKQKKENEGCVFIDEQSFEYMEKQAEKEKNVKISKVDALEFLRMDLDAVAKRVHMVSFTPASDEVEIAPEIIRIAAENDQKKKRDEKMKAFKKAFWNMELIDIYSSGLLSKTRFRVVKELMKKGAGEKDIKSIINPELRDEEVLRKKELWEEMRE